MSKENDLLNALKNNLGQWVCAYCASNSNQPAATFRNIKQLGYRFEEVSPGRWGLMRCCPVCGVKRTHYKLLSPEPVFDEKPRLSISSQQRKRVIALLDRRDAFTGASISSTPEIDHKVPLTRLEKDVDISTLSDDDIRLHFQLLTREHNLLKDRACGRCKLSGKRQPFLGISYWYEGDEEYCGSCVGCGWYDGKAWREDVDSRLT